MAWRRSSFNGAELELITLKDDKSYFVITGSLANRTTLQLVFWSQRGSTDGRSDVSIGDFILLDCLKPFF